jgi:hypothetical protein
VGTEKPSYKAQRSRTCPQPPTEILFLVSAVRGKARGLVMPRIG